MTTPSTLDVHIGAWPPSRWDEIDTIRAEQNPQAWGDEPRPTVTYEAIDWALLGWTPRWVGDDSSEAVVALEPSMFHDRGADEWRRFLDGARARGELALAVSQVGTLEEPTLRNLFGPRASVMLPGAYACSVGGKRLALASPPEPAPDLGRADRDLALRLVGTRPPALPWWQLELSGHEISRGGWQTEIAPTAGQLVPLLLSRAGEVVAAVWTSPDAAIRHYILPFMPSYVPVLQWLSERGVPEFVPTAARRRRASLATEAGLQTRAEAEARAELAELEDEYERRRSALQARVNVAAEAVDAVRDPLLYGTDAELVAAVSRVLTDAGMTVMDLDVMLGATANADLLVTWGDRNVLVEVKSAAGNPKEMLAEAPMRHLATWPRLRPDITVSRVALILNHQHRTHPLDRSPSPYSRPAFVEALSFPVVSTTQLFAWWRRGQYAEIRDAIFGV